MCGCIASRRTANARMLGDSGARSGHGLTSIVHHRMLRARGILMQRYHCLDRCARHRSGRFVAAVCCKLFARPRLRRRWRRRRRRVRPAKRAPRSSLPNILTGEMNHDASYSNAVLEARGANSGLIRLAGTLWTVTSPALDGAEKSCVWGTGEPSTAEWMVLVERKSC